jgi:predicted Rossmann-fold nucleotide-binding protein
MFRVIIAGSRDFSDLALLTEKCDKVLSVVKDTGIVIISGCARGADTLGAKYAESKGYPVMEYPANWKEDGKSAGYKRNVLMSKNADALIAFPKGASKGTKHMIDIAQSAGMPVRIFPT